MGIVIKNSLRNTIIMYSGILIGAINTILLYPQIISTVEYGLITTISSLAILIASLSAFGMPASVVKFMPSFNNKADTPPGSLLYFILLRGLFSVLLFSFILIVFKNLIITPYQKSAQLFVHYYYYLIPLFSLNLFINLFSSYANSIFESTFQFFVKEIFLRLSQSFLLGLFYYGIITFDIFIFLYVLIYLVSLFILIYYLKSVSPTSLISFKKILKEKKKEINSFSIYSFFSSIIRTLSFRIDIIMLSLLAISDISQNKGLEVTAIYGIALYIATVIEMPMRSLGQVINISLSQAWKDNDIDKITTIYKKATTNMNILGVFIFLVIWCSIDELVQILPPDYKAVKYTFLWLGLGKYFNTVFGINGYVLLYSPKYKYYSYIAFFGLVLTIITNYMFIPIWQTKGAALATSITYLIISILMWLSIIKLYKLQPFRLKDIIPLLIASCLIILNNYINIENLYFSIFIKSLVVSIIYWLIIIKLRISEDINTVINGILKKYLNKPIR